jgi:hypothetical protein
MLTPSAGGSSRNACSLAIVKDGTWATLRQGSFHPRVSSIPLSMHSCLAPSCPVSQMHGLTLAFSGSSGQRKLWFACCFVTTRLGVCAQSFATPRIILYLSLKSHISSGQRKMHFRVSEFHRLFSITRNRTLLWPEEVGYLHHTSLHSHRVALHNDSAVRVYLTFHTPMPSTFLSESVPF